MRPIRVLVVDDSAAMRALIRHNLQRDPGLVVVGEAGDASEARTAIKALSPDVVTLDVEMPHLDGITFLERIMRLRPMPVVMVSSATTRGADATIRALEIGAFDCVMKPTLEDRNTLDRLPAVIRQAAGWRPPLPPQGAARDPHPPPERATPRSSPEHDLIAMGASTGGVETLIRILSQFPGDCPPTVITQHMPALFTTSFAQRLDRVCAATVSEACDGAVLAPGQVYLAPGGAAHLEVDGKSRRCRLTASEPVNGHRPSVDVLFSSVARAAGPRAVGVILTGMGSDGAHGLLAMRRAGALTYGQDEASSVVYGMPRAAFELGAVAEQHPLDGMATAILRAFAAPRSHENREPAKRHA